MCTICCNIDGVDVQCESGQTVLEAARSAGLHIPTLCYFAGLNQIGACRMCVVEIKGMPRLMPACTTQVKDGMVIRTASRQVVDSRKRTLDILCKRHRMDCEYCPDYTFCELHALVREMGLDDRKYANVYHARNADESSPCIVRDNSKCVRCRRCVATCKAQGVEAIAALHRAEDTIMGAQVPLAETDCNGCGQCVRNCPTGALFVRDDTDLLWRALNNRKKLIFGIMPETANNIGRFFGAKTDNNELGRLATVCKKAGAYEVFDLTGLKETAVKDLGGKGTLCPAHMFRGKPHGRDLEEIFLERALKQYPNTPREDLFFVYFSGCTAAKQNHKCDAVLTTVELFHWVQRACVSKFTTLDVWKKAEESTPRRLLGSVLEPERTELTWVCPGGCQNGGGQFRTQGFQK